MNAEPRMSSELTVRFVTRQDHAQWLPLWDGYNGALRTVGPNRAGPRNHRHDLGALLRCLRAGACAGRCDGKLLGLTHYLFHRSTTAIDPVCYLQDLFTDQTARAKGVGRALINGVYQQAKLAGSPRVYWQTHQTNLTAMKLYDEVAEHSGFVVYRKLF
jgi:GNAT superfamily N-acetyltransferase